MSKYSTMYRNALGLDCALGLESATYTSHSSRPTLYSKTTTKKAVWCIEHGQENKANILTSSALPKVDNNMRQDEYPDTYISFPTPAFQSFCPGAEEISSNQLEEMEEIQRKENKCTKLSRFKASLKRLCHCIARVLQPSRRGEPACFVAHTPPRDPLPLTADMPREVSINSSACQLTQRPPSQRPSVLGSTLFIPKIRTNPLKACVNRPPFQSVNPENSDSEDFIPRHKQLDDCLSIDPTHYDPPKPRCVASPLHTYTPYRKGKHAKFNTGRYITSTPTSDSAYITPKQPKVSQIYRTFTPITISSPSTPSNPSFSSCSSSLNPSSTSSVTVKDPAATHQPTISPRRSVSPLRIGSLGFIPPKLTVKQRAILQATRIPKWVVENGRYRERKYVKTTGVGYRETKGIIHKFMEGKK